MLTLSVRRGSICGCLYHSGRFGFAIRCSHARGLLFHIHHGQPQPYAYIGITSDLQKRVFQHKWKEHDGFTARYNCDRLVWFESHDEVTKAIAREKTLKGWKRARKIALIESVNPAWIDLSREWYDCEPADYRRALDRVNL